MKKLGEIVREWREASGLDYAEVARRISKLKGGKPFNWQNIQNLEDPSKDIKRPLYLPELAKVMGTTVEALTEGKQPAVAVDQATGSKREPVAPPIHATVSRLTREQILAHCANLTDDQTHLLARLMAALGWMPGVLVEALPQWIPEVHKNMPSRGPTMFHMEHGRLNPDEEQEGGEAK